MNTLHYTRWKRSFALLLVCIFAFGLIPAQSFAATAPCTGEHSWATDILDQPSCIREGYGVRYCTVCGEQETINPPALGHSFEKVPGSTIEPTCTSSGSYTEACSRPNCSETRTVSIPPRGHDWGANTTVRYPWCVVNGYDSHTCKRCGATEEFETPALGHDFHVESTTATCLEAGTLTYTCDRCGKQTQTESPALGHDWSDWYTIISPTYFTEGMEERHCSRCYITEQRPLPAEEVPPYLVLPEGPDESETSPLYVTKTVVNSPADNVAFHAGESVLFSVKVTNTAEEGTDPIYFQIEDPLCEYYNDGMLSGGESRTFAISYTFTDQDAYALSVTNIAYVTDLTSFDIITSNPVTVLLEPFSSYEPAKVMVYKSITNLPESGVFQVGDTIEYAIEVDNNTEETITLVDVWDYMSKSEVKLTEEAVDLGPNDCIIIPFSYVIPESLGGATIVNFASAGYLLNGQYLTTISNDAVAQVACVDDALPYVNKYIESGPANCIFYTEGESIHYVFEVKNPSSAEFTNVQLYDPLLGQTLYTVPALSAGDGFKCDAYYTVTHDDVLNGAVYNTALLYCEDSFGMGIYSYSQEVMAMTGESGHVVLSKFLKNPKDSGEPFYPGETIIFCVGLVNGSNDPIHSIQIGDSLFPEKGFLSVISLDPGETVYYYDYYTVTEMDAIAGYVMNMAIGTYRDITDTAVLIESDTVTVPIEFPETIPNPAISVTKKEVSSPANMEYYTLGETITYEVTLTNTGSIKLDEVIVYDSLQYGSGEIAAAELFDTGDSRTYTFSHIVSQEDVERGYVLNVASAVGTTGFSSNILAVSNKVISPTAPVKEGWNAYDFVSLFPTLPSEDNTYCRRTLSPLGEDHVSYKIENCTLHSDTDEMILDLLEDADTAEARIAAYKTAADLWTAEIKAIFDELLYTITDSTTSMIVMNTQTMFFNQLASYEALLNEIFPNAPEKVAELKALELKKFCTDFCALTHNPDDCIAKAESAECDDMVTEDGIVQSLTVEAGLQYLNFAFCPTHIPSAANMLKLINGTATEKNTWEKSERNWSVAFRGMMSTLTDPIKGEARNIYISAGTDYIVWLDAWKAVLQLVYNDEELCQELMVRACMDRTVLLCDASHLTEGITMTPPETPAPELTPETAAPESDAAAESVTEAAPEVTAQPEPESTPEPVETGSPLTEAPGPERHIRKIARG